MVLDRMNGKKRSDYCGTLNIKDEGRTVTVFRSRAEADEFLKRSGGIGK